MRRSMKEPRVAGFPPKNSKTAGHGALCRRFADGVRRYPTEGFSASAAAPYPRVRGKNPGQHGGSKYRPSHRDRCGTQSTSLIVKYK